MFGISNAYDHVVLDFLQRYENIKNNENYDGIRDLFLQNISLNRDVYIYYGTSNIKDGSTMLNGQPLATTYIYAFFYPKNNNGYSNVFSIYDDYLGYTCDVIEYTRTSANLSNVVFYFRNAGSINEFVPLSANTNDKFLIPTNMFHISNKYFYDYFINNVSLQEIQENINNIDNQMNVITDDTISQDTQDEVDNAVEDLPVIFDNNFTSDVQTDESSLLNTILTPIYTYADGTTNRGVTFTLPFVNVSYTIRGNAISSHIRNTAIYTYVQLFWWVAFSVPIFFLLRRIIVWLGTGEFLNKPSAFAVYMSNFVTNNITPGMM